MDKYIPCTHCTVQQCNNCDYKIHRTIIDIFRHHKDNLIALRNHLKYYKNNDDFKQDFETVTDVLEGLEIVDHGEI